MADTYSAQGIGEIKKPVPRKRANRMAYRGIPLDILMVEPDRGCPGISDSCLECPLDTCLWDLPYRERAEVKRRFLEQRRPQQ